MLRVPNIGDYVCMCNPTISDNANGVETSTPAGTEFLVEKRRLLSGQQGL